MLLGWGNSRKQGLTMPLRAFPSENILGMEILSVLQRATL